MSAPPDPPPGRARSAAAAGGPGRTVSRLRRASGACRTRRGRHAARAEETADGKVVETRPEPATAGEGEARGDPREHDRRAGRGGAGPDGCVFAVPAQGLAWRLAP
ncbi:hypothetical protein GCM10010191_83950 [Actinomadura vinacea]|uniref:Uncharacterized protein n=1 Tax=Actinomadura vinacea TaxID=115336 RepID=A0ABP5XER7_9ACTN